MTRNRMISFRATDEERELFKKVAQSTKTEGLNLSDCIRRLMLKEAIRLLELEDVPDR